MSDLYDAAESGDLERVQMLVEQGVDTEKTGWNGWAPLIIATYCGHLEVVRYLLEQGANRDKVTLDGWTSLHIAARDDHLEIAKLLMLFGANLNARTDSGRLPIDRAATEEIKQAIRDEPRRRRDEAPGKRATEQDRHPNAASSASTQQEEEESNKQPTEGEAEEGKVADEDQDSEPSSDEDGN